MDVTSNLLEDWLILLHAPGVGPRTFADLLQHFPDPRAVRNARRAELAALGLDAAALDYLAAGQWPNWISISSGSSTPRIMR